MKTKILWFVFGFAISCIMWLSLCYIISRPIDLTKTFKESDKEIAGSSCDWFKSAIGRKVGNYTIYVPSDSENFSAMFCPTTANQSPRILIQDYSRDNKPGSILVTDLKHSISIDHITDDGMIGPYSYSIKENDKSISYTDTNMDGQFDLCDGPDNSPSVFINSKWQKLIVKDDDNNRYIDVDGSLQPVKFINGNWKIVEEE